VRVVAVLGDGRVVTGGDDGRVLVWDPAAPGVDPTELGRHDGLVEAVAVLGDGRVVTGGNDRRVLGLDPRPANDQPLQLTCSVTTLATAPAGHPGSSLAIAHQGSGFSLWSFTA
jgi:WD40 repeat protein